MLMALRLGWERSLAGHTSTQRVQPVQSSGATCTTYDRPARSAVCASGTVVNPAGAPAASAGSKTLVRMAACGQIIEHLLHWMHRSGSQIGISWAMARFS